MSTWDRSPDALPLLVLEQVDRDPASSTRLVGTLRVAGHRQRLVVDTGNPLGFVEHVEVPAVLARHDPSLAAVVAALARWAEGQDVELPLDLSDVVRDSDPPFPVTPLDPEERGRLEADADRVDLVVLAVRRTSTQPPAVAATLSLGGSVFDVEVEISGPAQDGVMVWRAGPDTDRFTPVELHAVYRALRPHAESS